MPLGFIAKKAGKMETKSQVKTVSQRVDDLCETIRKSSALEVDSLRQQYDELQEHIAREGATLGAAERRQILAEAQQQIEQADREASAQHRRQVRLKELQEQEAIFAKLEERILQAIPAYLHGQEYAEALPILLREALLQLQVEEAVLSCDPVTNSLLKEDLLRSLSAGLHMKITRGAELTGGHGLLAISGDGRRRFDNTLEARLQRKRAELRMQAAEILFEDDDDA